MHKYAQIYYVRRVSCMVQHICIVMQEFIHKVRTIGGGRSGSAQSVLARMGGGGEVQLELHVYYNSFAGTLQNKI